MANTLKISVVQADLVWEDPEANLGRLAEMFREIPHSDIIILPELFTTGFTMNVEASSEEMDGPSISWMFENAKIFETAICGSLLIKEADNFYNRLFFITPDGNKGQYDKRHLFRMGDEHNNFTPGNARVIINYMGWRILPQICYDLRFPVWSRNRNDYDLLINVANWPAPRKQVWETLLSARAIENQSFVVGANRVGTDGNGISHSGNSMLIDFKGRTIASIDDQKEGYITKTINLEDQLKFKKAFPAYLDSDDFKLTM